MSSRNAYLDLEQRKSALALYRSLIEVQKRFIQGERKVASLIETGQRALAEEPSVRLDYLEIVDPETLDQLDDVSHRALAAVAAFVGNTRLIDNIMLNAA